MVSQIVGVNPIETSVVSHIAVSQEYTLAARIPARMRAMLLGSRMLSSETQEHSEVTLLLLQRASALAVRQLRN